MPGIGAIFIGFLARAGALPAGDLRGTVARLSARSIAVIFTRCSSGIVAICASIMRRMEGSRITRRRMTPSCIKRMCSDITPAESPVAAIPLIPLMALIAAPDAAVAPADDVGGACPIAA